MPYPDKLVGVLVILLHATSEIFALPTAPALIVAANEPVPDPVTSPVNVMVWSPVLVPEEVPEKVPD